MRGAPETLTQPFCTMLSCPSPLKTWPTGQLKSLARWDRSRFISMANLDCATLLTHGSVCCTSSAGSPQTLLRKSCSYWPVSLQNKFELLFRICKRVETRTNKNSCVPEFRLVPPPPCSTGPRGQTSPDHGHRCGLTSNLGHRFRTGGRSRSKSLLQGKVLQECDIK